MIWVVAQGCHVILTVETVKGARVVCQTHEATQGRPGIKPPIDERDVPDNSDKAGWNCVGLGGSRARRDSDETVRVDIRHDRMKA